MANQLIILSTLCTCVLLLTGCKPDIDPKIIEAKQANAEAQCECLKQVDYSGCRARVDTEHPVTPLADGYAVKYSKESLAKYDAAVQMAFQCSEVASRAVRPE